MRNRTGQIEDLLIERSQVSMGRPVLPPEKLEQLPGLSKPASSARLSRGGGKIKSSRRIEFWK
jgi:hypothetical protein